MLVPRVLAVAVQSLAYLAVGLVPLYVGQVALSVFFGPGFWLSDTTAWLQWLALGILGYFFGWTLTSLALEYEDFWRVPGRVRAFRALWLADAPDGPLVRLIGSAGDVGEALRWQNLRGRGLDLGRVRPWQLGYATIRGACLAAGVALLFLVPGVIRQVVAGRSEVWSMALTGLAIAAFMLVAGVASHVLGQVLARAIADAAEKITEGDSLA